MPTSAKPRAYTINNAYATFELDIRGTMKAGQLAEITVCDRNLLKVDADDILQMNVEMTIEDGGIVYERGQP